MIYHIAFRNHRQPRAFRDDSSADKLAENAIARRFRRDVVAFVIPNARNRERLGTRVHDRQGIGRKYLGAKLLLRNVEAMLADENTKVLEPYALPFVLPPKIFVIVRE